MFNKYIKELKKLENSHNLRFLKPVSMRKEKTINYQNKIYINLSSNDYLGIGSDKKLLNEYYKKLNDNNIIEKYSLGSTSSRLLTGNFKEYGELEKTIAEFYKNKKAALVLNSGYHANIGILPALCSKKDLIISDKLNHASIIDGIRLSNCDFLRYNHLDYEHLDKILTKKRNNYDNIFIVTETVFSMDGDIADLTKLVELKHKFKTLLYIDEAHALGVFGKKGLGIAERDNVINDIDIIIGTFGKAFASLGAFVVTNSIIKDYLINKMRSLIFTTALSPIIVNWNKYIFENLIRLKERRNKLINLSRLLREDLKKINLTTRGMSQIVPVIIGDNIKTRKTAASLQEEGFLLFPICPPTVPANTSRLRISLTSNLDWEDIRQIPEIIKKQAG